MIRGENADNRDTSDAPLWFVTACAELSEREGQENLLDEPCGDRSIRRILLSIGDALTAGTPNGLKTDPESGLLFSPSHFTWMDTNHPASTPRQGYPVEIQALWFFALSFLSSIDDRDKRSDWAPMAKKVQNSIRDLYFLEEEGYLSDCLHAAPGIPAKKAVPDDALRPNQLFAITLGAIKDNRICRSILSACEELLVPGAIRSLADRPVRHPLEINHNGDILGDPVHPYRGIYGGDEDTKRKPAYHNGTAWTWVFPNFCEAWVSTYGNKGKGTAAALLSSSVELMSQGCVGHIPEILDGDAPHAPRGCDAQAWGASEWLRVWQVIKK
jgi:predicted glycogen debranching enzyme